MQMNLAHRIKDSIVISQGIVKLKLKKIVQKKRTTDYLQNTNFWL